MNHRLKCLSHAALLRFALAGTMQPPSRDSEDDTRSHTEAAGILDFLLEGRGVLGQARMPRLGHGSPQS